MAVQTVLLLNYNNYFNRIIKKESTADRYRATTSTRASYNNFNFNSNDGITTSITVGLGGEHSAIEKMDYVVVHDTYDVISSR